MTRGTNWSRMELVGEDVVVVDIYLAHIERPIQPIDSSQPLVRAANDITSNLAQR